MKKLVSSVTYRDAILFPQMRAFVVAIILLLMPLTSHAYRWLCERAGTCGSGGGSTRSSTSPAKPTSGSTISVNPAAVPTEKSFGAEAIYFKGSFDFALVKGLGRVGAGISPSNTEETFFGPPGFELTEDFLDRKINKEKYPSQKVTLATAFNVYSNDQKGLKRFDINLGVVGKYNRLASSLSPGGGLSGIAGPFTFGYSAYGDTFVVDYERYGLDEKKVFIYSVETYSIGVFLESFALDYSVLKLVAQDVATVSVATASLLLQKAMITASLRRENSDRPAYNYSTKLLETSKQKDELFGGVQVFVNSNLALGVFYNYYLLREFSFGATLFF